MVHKSIWPFIRLRSALHSSGNMYSGTVRNWFDSRRANGYGFIIPDIDGADVFVHRQNVMNATYLTTGDMMTYELQVNQRKNKNKLQAVKVWVVDFSPNCRLREEASSHTPVSPGLQAQINGVQVEPAGIWLCNLMSGTVSRLAVRVVNQTGWLQFGKACHLTQSLSLRLRAAYGRRS